MRRTASALSGPDHAKELDQILRADCHSPKSQGRGCSVHAWALAADHDLLPNWLRRSCIPYDPELERWRCSSAALVQAHAIVQQHGRMARTAGTGWFACPLITAMGRTRRELA